MGQIQQVFIVTYEKSLSVDCDLDFSASNMVLVLDTPSCYENYQYHIILKSHHTQDKVIGWTW